MITKLDFVAVPSQDSERSRRFYGETLGLRPDKHGQFEFWAGATCLGIWEPERLGMRGGVLRTILPSKTLPSGNTTVEPEYTGSTSLAWTASPG